MKKLLLLLLTIGCFVGVSGAQTFVTGQPFQIMKRAQCTSTSCTSSDSSTTGFPVSSGIGFYQLTWSTSGTVSSCSISLDSQENQAGSWTTGGIASSATIGSCASAGSYSNSTAVYANFARLTGSMTGSGSVTFTLFGNIFQGGGSSVTISGTPSFNLTKIAGSTVVADPCQVNARTTVVISQTASTQLVTGTSAKQTYVCYLQFSISNAADNIALVEGTGSVCGTSTAGMAGGATTATGWNLLANGSVTGGGISNWAYKTATLADNVCLLDSSAAQVSGVIQFVQQ